MKRTNQINKVVDEANVYLKANGIKSQYDPVFSFVTNCLLHQSLYQGFNYYNEEDRVCREENSAYIRIY